MDDDLSAQIKPGDSVSQVFVAVPCGGSDHKGFRPAEGEAESPEQKIQRRLKRMNQGMDTSKRMELMKKT